MVPRRFERPRWLGWFWVKKKKPFDSGSLVREMARERVGSVPPSKAFVPKTERRKPKHKKAISLENASE